MVPRERVRPACAQRPAGYFTATTCWKGMPDAENLLPASHNGAGKRRLVTRAIAVVALPGLGRYAGLASADATAPDGQLSHPLRSFELMFVTAAAGTVRSNRRRPVGWSA